MPHPLWLLLFPALLGLAFGSFLNVCIVRLPLGKSIVRPPSHCPQCKVPLSAWQNLPLLSWVLLRGRCHSCRKPIPVFYPLVEVAVAVWFILCTVQYTAGHDGTGAPAIFLALSHAILGWLLLGLAVTDARTGLLPDAFTFSGLLAAILLFASGTTLALPLDTGTDITTTTPEKVVVLRVASILIVTAALLLVRWLYRLLRKHEGMGLGDVKMTAMLTAFLGLPLTLLAFLAASIIGSLYAVTLLLRPRKDNTPRSVPFGTFLAIGGFYALIAGEATLHWYIHLMF
jgi:leader peptidase (prepilin peptidase)/N-methyltransferase